MSRAFPQTIALVALDDRDDGVLAAVRGLGRRGATERIYVLHVREQGRRFSGEHPAEAGRPAALDELVTHLDRELPRVEVVGIFAVGQPVEEIARVVEREDVDLVVLGRSEAEGGTAWGDHGLRVLRLSDCPVLVVPQGTTPAFANAMVGMDLSENAVAALVVTTGLCDATRALAVVDRASEGLDDEAYKGLVADTEARYAAALATSFGPASLPPLVVVDAASPTDALLGAAPADSGIDLLVVGSRGLTPLAAVLLGSTAERLGGRCAVPLLVWRRKGRQRGVWKALVG
jgi:nucleotide-binding universal stress UspA family protein